MNAKPEQTVLPGTAELRTDPLPFGWHPFPLEVPARAGLYVCRVTETTPDGGWQDLEFLNFGRVAVSIPGAHVIAQGFTFPRTEAIVTGVTAWRAVPDSWLP